jgi:predicted PurR-regulated permease PerM
MPGFARRVVVAVLITLGLLALAAAVWLGIHVLLEAFAGVLLGVFLSALADWLRRHSRLPYGWSLAVVVLGLCAVAVGTGWLLSNRVAAQLGQLLRQLPESLERARHELARYPLGQFLLDQAPQALQWGNWASILPKAGGLITSLTGLLEAVIVILVVGIFGAAEPDVYKAGLSHLVPPANRPRAREAVDAVTFTLRGWLVGQVFLMAAIGLTTGVGLWLIGVPFALALGVIAGILEMIPYLGAWLSAIPAGLMAFTVSPWHLLMVAILYLGIHILEGYVLLPLVQRRVVHLPPALTLTAQVLLGNLFGLLGLLVAAPLTAATVVLVKMLYVEDTLGDQTVEVPGEPGKERAQDGDEDPCIVDSA